MVLKRSHSAKLKSSPAVSSQSTGPMSPAIKTCENLPQSDFLLMELPRQISSAAGSRARTSALQGTARAWPVNDLDCGSSTTASLASFDHASRSWRTSERCFIEGWMPFSDALPNGGIMRGGELFQLGPLACPKFANGSGYWPTPIKSDGKRVAELKLHSLAKRCIGLPGCKWNFAEHVAAELDGYPTASFALSIMGFPPTWTELEQPETP